MGDEHWKRMPAELEREVLQHIANEDEGDRSRWLALINCALVCKAWTRHVRSHLYYAININTLKGLCQFKRLREHTHLRPFLREFIWPREKSMYCFNASDANILKNISPTVTKLIFRGVDYQSLTPPLMEAISTFTNITELDMTASTFEGWTTVVRVISSFTFLAILAMPRIVPYQDNGPEISYPPPSRLVHIKLASGCEKETVGWIRNGSQIPNIQTVEAESGIGSNVLAELLRSLDGDLRRLVIHIDSSRAFFIWGPCRQNLF